MPRKKKTSMAEIGSETDVKAVKEALITQQHLLQKLYAELDKEREASSIAADEALSMILRLQGEKAAVKMEAHQYQRMAEEKICHAEDSLASFEDIIYQKEMEIASLEFQVQAYRYKLLSLDMDCSDLGPCEFRFADNLLLQKNEFGHNGGNGVNGKVRRIKSLPPLELDESYYKKDTAEREPFLKPDFCVKSGHPSHYSYWEQIIMLDEQVKEISISKGCGEEISEINFACCDQTRQKNNTDYSVVEPEVTLEYSASSSVQDIFEIPEANQNVQKKLIFEDESRLGKPDSLPTEPSVLHYKGEQSKAKKASNCKSHKTKSSKSRRGKAVDSAASVDQNIDEIVVESEPFQQLRHRIDLLEQERIGTRPEISDAGIEELRLLKEIREQLNSIQSEMKSLKTKQPSEPDNSTVDVLSKVGCSEYCFSFLFAARSK